MRGRLMLIPYLLVVAAAAGLLLLWQARRGAEVPVLGKVVSTGAAAVGGPFTLTDQTGRKVSSSDFRGRYMLVYFGYSMCPDVCPTTLAVMADALGEIDPTARKIVPVFITVDPERDTPAVVGRFAAAFDPRIVGLTGTPAQIEAVKKVYAVWAARGDTSPGGGYLVNHSRQVYLMDPSNKPLALVPADEGPEAVARSLMPMCWPAT